MSKKKAGPQLATSVLALVALLGACAEPSNESEPSMTIVDETKLSENQGKSYGDIESSFAAQGGQMSFDDDNLRIAVAEVGEREISVFLTHEDAAEPARAVTAPDGSILAFAGYRIEVSVNGSNGFADVSKELP